MTERHERLPGIGVLWRADRRAEAPAPRADRGLGALYAAFDRLPLTVEQVPYSDDAVGEVREELLTLDGVLVWVNPIQDGQNRRLRDQLLRDVSSQGVWCPPIPTSYSRWAPRRSCPGPATWAGEATPAFTGPWASSPATSPAAGPAGPAGRETGQGKRRGRCVEGRTPRRRARSGRPAGRRAGSGCADEGQLFRTANTGILHAAVRGLFRLVGCLIDQVFQERLAEGMIRCYFSRDQVVGFCHQWPTALLDDDPHQGSRPSLGMEGPDVPAYQPIRVQAESHWVPQMTGALGIQSHDLPAILDADFLYGPKTATGADTYVCARSTSAPCGPSHPWQHQPWPLPPWMASGCGARLRPCAGARTPDPAAKCRVHHRARAFTPGWGLDSRSGREVPAPAGVAAIPTPRTREAASRITAGYGSHRDLRQPSDWRTRSSSVPTCRSSSTCRTRPAHILPGARFTRISDRLRRSLKAPVPDNRS